MNTGNTTVQYLLGISTLQVISIPFTSSMQTTNHTCTCRTNLTLSKEQLRHVFCSSSSVTVTDFSLNNSISMSYILSTTECIIQPSYYSTQTSTSTTDWQSVTTILYALFSSSRNLSVYIVIANSLSYRLITLDYFSSILVMSANPGIH